MINNVDKISSKMVKVSANGRRVFVDPKTKIVTQCNKSLISRLPLKKRKRANECENKCSSCSRRTFLKNYSNFMKSGLPQHLLFSQDGQWVDFSQEVVDLVKEGFQSKRLAIEVKCNRCHFMLDILYMVQIDLKTGAHKPIGWIDEAGNCIFPELYSSCHGYHEDSDLDEPSNTPEMELELNGLDNNKVVGESNVKRVKVDQKSPKNITALPVEEKKGGMLSKHIHQKGILLQQASCEKTTGLQKVDGLEQKRDNMGKCFCTFCQCDVPFRIAKRCSVCQGYCHEECAVGTNIQTESLTSCKRCYIEKDVTPEKEIVDDSPTSSSLLQGQESQPSTTLDKVAKQNGHERPLEDSNPTSSQPEKGTSGEKNSKNNKLCLGLIWKKKNTGTEFRINNILLKGNPSGRLLAPECYLCAQPYNSELMYIRCEKCNHWFHAESVELHESQILGLFGFKCCKCRRIRIPICPYTDPETRVKLEAKKEAVAKVQKRRFLESDFYSGFNSDTIDELVKED